MNRLFLVVVLFSGLTYMPVSAQQNVSHSVNASHYIKMYNCILDSLDIKEVYVSDSLRALESFGWDLYRLKLRDTVPIYNPSARPKAEYSVLLQSHFNAIEDIVRPIPVPLCLNVIYFSFPDESYICAEVYVCVRRIWRMDDFPTWGHYRELYSFLFRIEDNGITCLDITPIYEM